MAISDTRVEYESALGHAWPPVARNLVRSLRARGVDHPTSEDIAQEVAARALKTAVPFASADDLAPWANKVGHRLATDAWRRCAFVSCADVPDAPAPDDVSRRVEARLALEVVEREVRTLPPTDRQALAYTLGGPPPVDSQEAAHWDDRRRRAREVLRHQAVGFVRLKTERLRFGLDRAAEMLASAGPALFVCAVQATAVLVAPVHGGRTLPPNAPVAMPTAVAATTTQPTAPPPTSQLDARAGPGARAPMPPSGPGPGAPSPSTVEVTVPGPPRPTGNTSGRVDDNDDGEWLVCANGNCVRPPLPKDPPVTLPLRP